jgi:alanine dehydrogenase
VETLLLSRLDVERLLTPDACIEAVEDAFRRLGAGKGEAQLRALLRVRRPRRVLAYDQDGRKAAAFAEAMAKALGIATSPARDLAEAVGESRIIITCTTARRFFITREMVQPGTFIAAVGADHEEKQEIEPLLLSESKLVTDVTDQACKIGDLHHALVAGVMTRDAVHAELGEVVAGRKAGRVRDDEIIVFDSTGTGLQDVAAAIAVYKKALHDGSGRSFVLSEGQAA